MVATDIANTIWRIADVLRGEYKQSEYGRIILPLTLLRRLDCLLEDSKEAVLAEYEQKKSLNIPVEPFLLKASGQSFYNISPWNLKKVMGDPENIKANLIQYLGGFSEEVRDIFDQFNFTVQIERLDQQGLLYYVLQRFAEINLGPQDLDSMDMSVYYEELIRRFSEMSNETAGEHFTPREVIRLMVNLLFANDSEALTKPGIVRTIYDPTAGTGGMLSIADETIAPLNPSARLVMFGQELNAESYAICKSELLIKNQDTRNIIKGNTLSEDGHFGKCFDYMLSNPPFGVEWKKIEDVVRKEHEQKGLSGRFGPGLPRVSDGSLLFLLHLLSKMNTPEKGGSRIGIVFNGSPLFTGSAGSGETEIRKWIIENDWLEAIVALPTDMFYNTGISTYVWILTNRKVRERQRKIQLVNATEMYQKMRKSLGSKRNELSDNDIERIVKLYGAFEDNEQSKIFDNADFGYTTITVERPLKLNFQASPERIARIGEQSAFQKKGVDLAGIEKVVKRLGAERVFKERPGFLKEFNRALDAEGVSLNAAQFKALWQVLSERDETAAVCKDKKGKPEPDTELRDTENVPLKEDVQAYFEREVLPYAPDAWIDYGKTKVGYEISFNRYFYKYIPPRSLDEIDEDMKKLSQEIIDLLGGSVG